MLLINADDLGMTLGANRAIFEGYDKGGITHTSIMANCDYFDEAMEGVNERTDLGLGMHLNITYGKPLMKSSYYCDMNGIFNLSYFDLLKNRDHNFLAAVEEEWEAQIKRVLNSSNMKKLTHIDSHRHVHMIPHLYKIVVKLAKKYNVERIRLMNEKLLHSLLLTKRFNFFRNGGIAKYFLLRSFSSCDAKYANFYGDIKFYSILYTGVISDDVIQKLIHAKETYEIMVHPSYTKLDGNVHFYDAAEKAYRLFHGREKELEAVLVIQK